MPAYLPLWIISSSRAEGIEVEFISPTTPADGLKLLANGGVNFATAHSTEVITARSKGLPVVSIATNHQYGMAGIMLPTSSGISHSRSSKERLWA